MKTGEQTKDACSGNSFANLMASNLEAYFEGVFCVLRNLHRVNGQSKGKSVGEHHVPPRIWFGILVKRHILWAVD